MAITPTPLIPGATLALAATTLYTVPPSTSAKVGGVVFINTGAATAALTVSIIRSGAGGKVVISGMPLSSGQAYISPELGGQVLLAGDSIAAIASVAGVVNVVGSGITF